MLQKIEDQKWLLTVSIIVWILAIISHLTSARPHIEDELEDIKNQLGVVFTNKIPSDYYTRKNLQDCHSRFHRRSVNKHQMAVFNGTSVNGTEFPHMAVLGWTTPTGTTLWKCGGSLITERFVLTAGHCALADRKNPPDVVRLGDVNLELTSDDHYAQQIKVKRLIKHPGRNPPLRYNDLALVELEKKVKLTPGVFPACIWSKEVYPYDWFDVAGFGSTEFGEQSSPKLLKAQLTVVNSTECGSAYTTDRGLPDGIRADQVCASSNYSDTCQGDSGGPLQTSLFSYQHIAHFLIGVTSFGSFCGYGSYGVYQRIEPHLNWIRSVVTDSLDPLECTEKYRDYMEPMQMPGETEVVDPYISRVYLHWDDSRTDILCGGTLVDYNVVITSASCTFNSRRESPTRISIIHRFAKIVEIERHPQFKQGSYYNDVALLRLDRYVAAAEWIVPVCLPYPSALQGHQLAPETFSCRTPKAPYPNKLQIFLPSKSRCDEQTLVNDIEYSSKFPQGLGNAMSCIGTDYHMVPDMVEIDKGGPLLSRDETIIFGVNAYGTDCGSYNPLITTNVAPLIPWIEQFVFKPNADISSQSPPKTLIYEDKTLYIGSKCNTKDGKRGSCGLTKNCPQELSRYKHREVEPAICGFVNERVVICCPS